MTQRDPTQDQRYTNFVRLLARHEQSIRRFARSLLPSRDGVDDVVQDTALECWKKFSDFCPTDPSQADDEFIRWACVIARFKTMSWQRDKGRDRLEFRESVVERLAQAAVDRLDQQELEQAAIETCLEALSADQRRLVLSVHSPGESIAAIAEETGEAARRLYTRVNVLRRRLLECVQRRIATEVGNG